MNWLKIAEGELDVREDKFSNEDLGGRIEAYRDAVRDSRYTMKVGDAYCAAFVSWVMEQAVEPLAHDKGLGISYVPWIIDYLKDEEIWKTPDVYEPCPGDIVVFEFGNKRPNHVGFVEKVEEKGVIITIEGNVGGYPSGGVKRLRRRIEDGVVGFGEMEMTL